MVRQKGSAFGENLKDAHSDRRRGTGGEPGRRYRVFSVTRNSVTTVTLDAARATIRHSVMQDCSQRAMPVSPRVSLERNAK
jgi:hypothetical protein